LNRIKSKPQSSATENTIAMAVRFGSKCNY